MLSLVKIFSNSEKSNPVFSRSFDILICSKTFIILLFLFPSWIEHRVGVNLSNEERISISFNLS